jgi:acetyltransferase
VTSRQGRLAEKTRTASEKSAKAGAKSCLDALFVPDSVAVIGATERPGTVGRTVLSNLIESRSRSKVYAVNPSHSEVLGLKAYKSIGDISEKVDLAVVVTPAVTVSNVIGECVDAGVRAAVVISAGFRERGPEGAALEQQIQQQLRRGCKTLW